ncbi:MAG: hypothetical protein L0Z52_01170 [Acidobacteria bacterium]|nr:hypothetical protein [Acidobacteriota bacterium]
MGVFTATRWERRAVTKAILIEEQIRIGHSVCVVGRRGACRVYVVQTGIGPVNAATVCREVLATHSWDLAISSGFACALTPSLIGDVLIGTEVVPRHELDSSSPRDISCSPDLNQTALQAARRVGITARPGRFVTVAEVLWLAEQKRRIAAETSALGLDMESAAVGSAAAERQIPFLITRTVSDLLDEDLPLDFNQFLQAGGWPGGVRQVLREPSRLAGLIRLGRQSRRAAGHLTTFMESFLESLA